MSLRVVGFASVLLGLLATGCGPADSASKKSGDPRSANSTGAANDGGQPAKSTEVPAGTYNDTLGETPAPPDPSRPGTILRARASDTVYRLSNARFGKDQFGRPTLDLDYEMVRSGQHNGVTLVMRGADGSTRSFLIMGPMQERGTLSVDLPFPLPPGEPPLPKDFEVYLTRGDMRYVPNPPTFKVSNSATAGNMTARTLPRDWTAEEIARFAAPPPNYTTPNVHAGVGRDTEFAGDTTGGLPNRYVEPGGKLLGLEWQPWDWEGERTFWGLTPVFERAQPTVLPHRILAREGYAVGAVRVRAKRFVNAIQLVFYKVKPDGTLDPADSYEGEWAGDTASDAEPKTLDGGGAPVVGIVCQKGAIVNGLALVLER